MSADLDQLELAKCPCGSRLLARTIDVDKVSVLKRSYESGWTCPNCSGASMFVECELSDVGNVEDA